MPSDALLPAQGELIQQAELKIESAQQFAHLLTEGSEGTFATLRETRRVTSRAAEIVVFSVEVERPQELAFDIRRNEIVEAVFFEDKDKAPEVNCLRADFPQAPHQNLTLREFPRQLCLYEQAWPEIRLNWTSGRFLNRIRYWLAKTAAGTLHAADQPLEPLIMPSGSRLILPSDFSYGEDHQKQGLLDIYLIEQGVNEMTLIADWKGKQGSAKRHSVAAVFYGAPQTHGVVRRQPETLQDLNELCLAAGLNLCGELASKIQAWMLEKPDQRILEAQLIIILLLPKKRKSEGVESVEIVAFVTGKSVTVVGQHLGVIQKHGQSTGYVLGAIQPKPEALRQVPVALVQVYKKLSTESAASMNGVEQFQKRIFAIGVGALGSQIFNNLVRAGFGKWTILDPDVLLPHNCARHFLGDWAVGQKKADAMAVVANAVLDGDAVATSVTADFLKPGDSKGLIDAALNEASLVMDFSASVAVARRLSQLENIPRCLAAYLAPSGNSLSIGVEDAKRKIRLDWLEMLHYRAVLNNAFLSKTFASSDEHLRYGNACRDVSTKLSQDDVGIWAGVASKQIKQMVKAKEASLKVYASTDDTEVRLDNVEISKLHSEKVGEWTIRFDDWLLKKLAECRKVKLPNETGGVLIGHFDTHTRICSIVDLISSPPDSQEWPMSYIRGCDGLEQRVTEIDQRTLGQMTYVGEWHSHPNGCSVLPSSDDMKAYSWLEANMGVEGLPAIMMIVGERRRVAFVIRS